MGVLYTNKLSNVLYIDYTLCIKLSYNPLS